eukprot:TRINITY_DN4257_c0_g1_i1.p1 TRINITY_DN4257_c0_g1~~TRINITY_DN4257_c0_g1_i1.p1  ORF type:complete len:352 (+),score=112.35 TRINITY_DN4257_c0_g1_i1:95-1150(+)
MFGGGFGNNNNRNNPNNDSVIQNALNDSISSISWSPNSNFFVASDWGGTVRCWQVDGNSCESEAKAEKMHNDGIPILDTAWTGDGKNVFTAGCDNQVLHWELGSNTMNQIAEHDAPVKCVEWIEEMNLLVTGSWDKTIRYWDVRQNNCAHTQNVPDKVYSMDVRHPVLAVATAKKKIEIYDLVSPDKPFRQSNSSLKHQSRCIAIFPDQSGYALGSIEGRVAINHIVDNLRDKDFAFKCHRQNGKAGKGCDIYSVNVLAFHNQFGTFATCGADGEFNFWDKDSKQRLKSFNRMNNSIPCASWNADGTIFSYAVSYDWSKGNQHYDENFQNNIFLHKTKEEEIRNRKGKKRR